MALSAVELIEQGNFIGQEFLVWLWMRALNEGGTSGLDDDESACFIQSSLAFVGDTGELKKSTFNGNPAESQEAFESLARGMRPSKAKLKIMAGDLEWSFTLSTHTLDISGLKLPPSTAKGEEMDRLQDRIFLLEECMTHLNRRYAVFLERRTTDPDGLKAELDEWIAKGCAGDIGKQPIPSEEDEGEGDGGSEDGDGD
jgi:hypothetical protein